MHPIPSPPDLATFGTNIAVFVVAVAATMGGVWKALRTLRKDDEKGPGSSSFHGGVIMENTTMLLMTESNKDVCRSNESLKASNYAVRDEIVELRHKLEMLTFALDRRTK